jgi:hypothetical protein
MKQGISSNLTLWVLYTSSWLYDTSSPFLLVKLTVVFLPTSDRRITKRFVVNKLDFDMVYKLFIGYMIIIKRVSYLICEVYNSIKLENYVYVFWFSYKYYQMSVVFDLQSVHYSKKVKTQKVSRRLIQPRPKGKGKIKCDTS